MGCAITRIVKFLRRGEKGNSLITAVTNLRKYTLVQWQSYGAVNKQNNWTNISNAADMKVGDTIVINGVVADKENISISLYATIVAITETTVIANSTTIIMAGDPGSPGGKGDRGPALRGPQDFSSLPTDYQFYQGADSDPYVDIVYYKGSYYKCVWTHKKRSDDISSSGGLSAKYWALSDKVEMIATKILLASYALIKNLGVEAIEMKDKSDNIVFKAKDGSVICKSGTFENVTVTGNIMANMLLLKRATNINNIDGTLIFGRGTIPIVLPEIPEGRCQNIKIAAPLITRSSLDATVKPQNTKVKIWLMDGNNLAASETKSLGYGLFDVVGVGYSDSTLWMIK